MNFSVDGAPQGRATVAKIRELLLALDSERTVVVVLDGSRGSRWTAEGSGRAGFRLTHLDGPSGDLSASIDHSLPVPVVASILGAYARGDPRWRRATAYELLHRGKPVRAFLGRVPVGVWAALIFGIPTVVAGSYSVVQGGPGAPSWSDIFVRALPTVLVMAALLQYFHYFFTSGRNGIRDWLGRRLGISIRTEVGYSATAAIFSESSGVTEDWVSAPGTSLAKRAIVQVLDLAVLLVGTVGVVAAITIPAFLIADRFG
ncbi:MAG: hypothetical protein ACKVT1_03025 [Dehalococcoidia bacterium]